MPYTFEQVVEIVNDFQKKQPEIEGIVTFLKEILKIQSKSKNNLNVSSPGLDKEQKKQKLEKGFPVLEFNHILDLLQRSTLLRKELSDLIKKRGPLVAQNMEKIENRLLEDHTIFFTLSQNYLIHNRTSFKDFAQTNDLDVNLLLFFIKNSIKPFIESMAEKILKTCDLSLWSQAFCPICGSPPALSYLKFLQSDGAGLITKGKKRMLFCSLCNSAWQFPRLKCPFCLTEKQDALGYFYLEDGEKGYRVDICNNCKGYIKTIDLEYTFISEELIFLEDIHTINLDLLAEKEGFYRKAEKVFLL